jgi:hypothetical protein
LLLAVLTQPVLAEDKPLGLGLELRPVEDALVVEKVLPGGPAARARIKEGDRIVAIDGQSTEGRSADDLAQLLRTQEPSVTLTVASTGRAPRQLRIQREPIDVRKFQEGVPEGAVLAAARAHARVQARRALEEALLEQAEELVVVDQAAAPAETLQEALPRELEFMAKVGQLTARERELLKKGGEQAIERREALFVRRPDARVGRRVAVMINGQNQMRQVAQPESPDQAVRRELTPLLKSISPEAWEKFDAERGRLDERRKRTEVLRQVAAFDEALLLTAEQREKLCDLLSSRWTDFWRGVAHPWGTADPAQFCVSAAGAMDLFSIPDAELESILRPNQIAAFKLVQLPTRLETVFLRPAPQPDQAPMDPGAQNNGAAVRVRVLGAVQERAVVGGKVVRHGLPLEEQRERLTSLLERLVEDADVHADLDDGQNQKLLLSGRLDLDRHFQQYAALDKLEPGQLVIAAENQVAGTRVRLAPIFADPNSMFQKILQSRLSREQLEKLAEAQCQRGRFHRQAVLSTLSAALAQRAALTADQAERVAEQVGESLAAPSDAGDLAGWRRATLDGLGALRALEFKPLVDNWQWPAAREYLNNLAIAARALATQPADFPLQLPADFPGRIHIQEEDEALLGVPAAP